MFYTTVIVGHVGAFKSDSKGGTLRYLLFPKQERQFLASLRDDFNLTPIVPQEFSKITKETQIAECEDWRNSAEPWKYEIVLWAKDFGPIARLGERPEPVRPSTTSL